MKLDTGSVIECDPSCTGFQPAPALCRASAGHYFHDGKHTLSGIFSGSCVIRTCTLTDVQVIDADTDKERTAISRCSADCDIILGEIPSLDDAAQIADIGAGSRITAVLDDLHRFLIVSAALQTIVAECGTVLCTEQIRRMVGNGSLHIRILAEIGGDGDEQYESRKDTGDLDADLLNEINNIRVFDPACGTGNFLMVCYRELKKLELQIKKYCNENRKPYTEKDYVTAEHFYGFESNPVATAISQMGLAFTAQKYNDTDTGDIVLPVNTICNGSALLLDWDTFCPKTNVKVFIVGNPSYKGAHTLSAAQQHEVQSALSEEIANGFKAGELDYAAAYFYKATRYIAGTDGGFAFVTTNSLTQGIHVPTLWPMLFSHGISISFAHTSFKWKNEGRNTTAVTVVIIGCRSVNNPHDKTIYDGNLSYDADDISPYLTKGGVIVSKENRGPICSWMPKMIKGNMPYNTDYLLLGPDDRQTLIETYPTSSRFLRRAVGSEEFVKGKERWCLWIYDEDLQAAMDIPPIADRIEAVRMARLASKDKSVKKMASRAHQFREMNMPEKYSLVVPSVTSENRPYLQVGYLGTKYVVTNLAFVIYDANPWVFGLISSKMHNLWVRTICGGLETRIRYSNVLGYNTFPVPTLTEEQKKAISDAALGVIMERE